MLAWLSSKKTCGLLPWSVFSTYLFDDLASAICRQLLLKKLGISWFVLLLTFSLFVAVWFWTRTWIRNAHHGPKTTFIGQWWWLSWQSSRFLHQRSSGWIVSLAHYYNHFLSVNWIEKTRIMKKMPGMAHIKTLLLCISQASLNLSNINILWSSQVKKY